MIIAHLAIHHGGTVGVQLFQMEIILQPYWQSAAILAVIEDGVGGREELIFEKRSGPCEDQKKEAQKIYWWYWRRFFEEKKKKISNLSEIVCWYSI